MQGLVADAEIVSNYAKLVTSNDVAASLSDPHLPDNPIIECNQAFLDLTGYARDEVIGRNCRFLAGPQTSPSARARLREAIDNLQPTIVEVLNYRKCGTPFINAVMICPIFNAQNRLVAFVGTQSEVRRIEGSNAGLTDTPAAGRLDALTGHRQADQAARLRSAHLRENRQVASRSRPQVAWCRQHCRGDPHRHSGGLLTCTFGHMAV
jgi:PAS domain S-box-containing protein